MHQQFFSLSPMAGQENFNGAPQMMANTPTTSSMLAALQNDFPTGSLDATSNAFNSDYGSLSYMDTTAPQDDSIQPVHVSGLTFPDFSSAGGSFDVGGFGTQDLNVNMHSSNTPSSEPEHDPQSEASKSEQQQGGI